MSIKSEPFIITAPSGAGKSSLIKSIIEEGKSNFLSLQQQESQELMRFVVRIILF